MSDRVELDESLAIDILTPLMDYADLTGKAGDGTKARILLALLGDAQKQLEDVFGQVNRRCPEIRVNRPFRE